MYKFPRLASTIRGPNNIKANTLSSIQKRFFNENNLKHAIENIETRWALLPEAERGAIADALASKQKGDWKKLSFQEKRAAYWIAYGDHGRRNKTDPAFWYKVAMRSSAIVLLCLAAGFYAQDQMNSKRAELHPAFQAKIAGHIYENKINPISFKELHDRKIELPNKKDD